MKINPIQNQRVAAVEGEAEVYRALTDVISRLQVTVQAIEESTEKSSIL